MKKIYYIAADRGRYDSYDSHVVIAETPEQVIELVAESPGDEGAEAWKLENVEHVGTPNDNQPVGILLSSFNAG